MLMRLKRALERFGKEYWPVPVVAAGYFVIARLTLSQLFLVTWDVVPVWPAAGWAVASVVRWKRPGLVGVLVGATLHHWPWLTDAPMLLVLAGILLETVVGASLIEYLSKDRKMWLSRVRDLPLLAASAAISATLSATFGVLGACWSGQVSWSAFVTKWLVFWLGDSLGIVFVVPVFLTFIAARFRFEPRRVLELGALAAATVSLSLVLFGTAYAQESALTFYFPILIWAGLRFGLLGASSASLAICSFALWGTAHGTGLFAHGTPHHQMELLWSFLMLVAVTTLLLGASLEEWRRAQEVLAERESLLSSFYDGSPVMMGIVEVRGNELVFVSGNAALERWLEQPREFIQGRSAKELGRSEKQIRLWIDKCLESRERTTSVRFEYGRTSNRGKQTMAAVVHPLGTGPVPRFSFVLEDVTERLSVQRELDRFFTLSLDMLVIAGVDGFIKRVNPSFRETSGLSDTELQTRPFLDWVHPDDRESAQREVERVGAGQKTIDFVCRCLCAGGIYRSLSWTGMAEADEGLIYAAARDVTDANAAAEALRESKGRAEAATKAKTEFLANMSHELRTPLSAIIGMAELIGGTALDVEQREYVDGVRHSANSLLLLVNDLLDLAKIESGKLDLETTSFELERILESSLNPLAYQAHRKGLDLVYSIASGSPNELVGDPTRLQQVLVNLVSNAVKFTDSGHVAVEVLAEPAPAGDVELHVGVHDTGSGIPEDRRAEIFESFVQGDGSTTRKHGGTGLGLAICNRLVSLMGGRIWVESEVGRGSSFHFTARLARSEAQDSDRHESPPLFGAMRVLVVSASSIVRRALVTALETGGMNVVEAPDGSEAVRMARVARRDGRSFQVAFVAYSLVGDSSAAWLRALRSEEPSLRWVLLTRTTDRLDEEYRARLGVEGRLVQPVAPRHLRRTLELILSPGQIREIDPVTDNFARQPRRRLKILVADDDSMNRTVTTKLLTKAGHEVVTVRDGREAVERVKSGRFDLIFMDLQMPEIDGLEAAARIRAHEITLRDRRTPIVALTANARTDDRDHCLNSGMDGYLVKPVEIRSLLAVVERVGAETESPTGSERGAPSVVDTSELESLVQGDDAVLREVLELFVEQTPALVDDISRSLDARDWSAAERGAHRLKGSLLTLGASDAAAIASRLEIAARETPSPEIGREWELLRVQLDRISQELETRLRRPVTQ
jgi:PAS domain S-box-containing protein